MGNQGDREADETLSISSRTEGRRVVVDVSGELDLDSSDRLVAEVQQLTRSAEGVEIDASGLTFADSAGLRALLLAQSDAKEAGVAFRITAVSPYVARLIEIAGLSDLLLPGDAQSAPSQQGP